MSTPDPQQQQQQAAHCSPERFSGELKAGPCGRQARLRGQVQKYCLIRRHAACAVTSQHCHRRAVSCAACSTHDDLFRVELARPEGQMTHACSSHAGLAMLLVLGNETGFSAKTQTTLHLGVHPRLLLLATPGAHQHWSRSQRRCSSARLRLLAWQSGQSRRKWCRTGRGQRGTAQAPAGRHW